MPAKKKYKDFEAAVERLEEITELLESDEVSLEESIKLYTEGLEIANTCTKQLSEAEGKIRIIREKSGIKVEEDFEVDDE